MGKIEKQQVIEAFELIERYIEQLKIDAEIDTNRLTIKKFMNDNWFNLNSTLIKALESIIGRYQNIIYTDQLTYYIVRRSGGMGESNIKKLCVHLGIDYEEFRETRYSNFRVVKT